MSAGVEAVSPTLGMIRAVTLTASNLNAVERGYSQVLGYRLVARRPVTSAEAKNWGATAAEGREMLVLRPASGAETELRFIQWEAPASHAPFATWGWNALEVIVQDPDTLAEQIERSDEFTLTSPPHGIDTFPYLRACQAIGPAGEYINFTRIDPPRPDLPIAQSFVDRCFIVTLGGPSIDALLDFYGRQFGNETSEVRQVRLRMMNLNCGLDEETKHPLATVRLSGRTKLELDQCPEAAEPRGSDDNGLPWGVCLVSLECSDLAPHMDKALGPLLEEAGQRRITLKGPGGERVELVEVAAA